MKQIFLLIIGFCLMVNMAFANSLAPVAKLKKAKPVRSAVVLTSVPQKVAPAIKVSIDLIRTLGVKTPGTPAYWQAEVRNIGLGNIAANTLKIKARQSHMQSQGQPATAPFAAIHSMRPGQKRGFQANWTPIANCTHLEIIVMDSHNKVLARKMHLVEFPKLQSVPREMDLVKSTKLQSMPMYIKVAKIESVKRTENPVEGFDYSFQVNCKKLMAGNLSSSRIAIVLKLADSEGNKFWKGSWNTGHTISTNYFQIKGTFKYKEAHDTVILEMWDRSINKKISEQSFKCRSLTQ